MRTKKKKAKVKGGRGERVDDMEKDGKNEKG